MAAPKDRRKLPLTPEARPTAVEVSAPYLRDTVTGATPFTVPALHLGAAALFLLAGGICLAVVAPSLAAGLFPAPAIIATTHLFTLGVITVTIFGALAQIFPVAFGAPLASARAAFVAWALMVAGIPLFVAGLWISLHPLRDVGLFTATAGFITAGINVARTLPRATSRGPAWVAVGIALGFLALTIVLGMLLAANLQLGFIEGFRLRTLSVHLHLAILGWALMMIIGIGHRLLPFFVVAEDVERPHTKWSLACMVPGTLLVGAGLTGGWSVITWAGLVLVEVALVLLFAQAFLVLRSGRRKLDLALALVAAGLACLAIAAVLAPMVLMRVSGNLRLSVAYVTAGLLGVMLFIAGVTNRIAPFMSWISRFRARQGKERIPIVAELPSRPLALAQVVTMPGGTLLLVTGILLGNVVVTRGGAVLFALGTALHAAQMAWVAWGRRHAA